MLCCPHCAGRKAGSGRGSLVRDHRAPHAPTPQEGGQVPGHEFQRRVSQVLLPKTRVLQEAGHREGAPDPRGRNPNRRKRGEKKPDSRSETQTSRIFPVPQFPYPTVNAAQTPPADPLNNPGFQVPAPPRPALCNLAPVACPLWTTGRRFPSALSATYPASAAAVPLPCPPLPQGGRRGCRACPEPPPQSPAAPGPRPDPRLVLGAAARPPPPHASPRPPPPPRRSRGAGAARLLLPQPHLGRRAGRRRGMGRPRAGAGAGARAGA